MRHPTATVALALLLSVATVATASAQNDRADDHQQPNSSVQLGPRPFFLVNEMEDGQAETPTSTVLRPVHSRRATSRSAIAVPPAVSRSTPGSPTKPVRDWARASWSATSPSRKTSNWSAATHRTICTRPPTFW